MGNSHSVPLEQCLNAVCGGRIACVSYPSDPLYQALWVRPYNLNIPVTPVAVIRPDNAEDVSKAIICATRNNFHVQARSGGHSYANFGLGGQSGELVIDLCHLKDFSMNTENWQATFGAGYRLGEIDQQLHSHGGRAMAHGTCPGVGVGGHATIGGIGPSSRQWGTALDHVLEVEVVTADGRILKASEKENSDLFWALRGAGAGYGVITKFTVRTEPQPATVVQYTYRFRVGTQIQMAPIYEAWQRLVNDPNLDKRYSTLFIVEPLGAIITGTFYGTKAEFDASGIHDKLPPGGILDLKLMDWLGSLAHIAEEVALALSDISTQFYGKSLAFREQDALGHDSIEELFAYMGDNTPGTLLWFVIFDSEGGAINEVPINATAYPHRDKLMMYQSYTIGLPVLTDEAIHWVEGVHDVIQRGAPEAHTKYAGYVDPLMTRSAAQQAYWSFKLPRLEEIKHKWDPRDVFHNPQSVDPVGL